MEPKNYLLNSRLIIPNLSLTSGHKYSRAKKNTIEFFNELISKTIKEVLIASDDRIIKITTDEGDLIFAIRGKYTNLFFQFKKSYLHLKMKVKKI